MNELMDLLMETREEGTWPDRIQGVVPALVTNNVDPDNLARVKVKYPWLSDKDESYWARIATLMAGKGRGSFFVPEVDDEVLVAFQHGDFRFPFIIGMLWNGVDLPPYNNQRGINDNKKNNLRVIRSRSGHELIFDDSKAKKKEMVILHTNAGHTLTMDDTDKKEKISLIDKTKDNFLEIDSVKDNTTLQTEKITLIKDKTQENFIEINAPNHTIEIVGKDKILVRDLSSNNSVTIDSKANTITVDAKNKIIAKSGGNKVEINSTSNSIKLEAKAKLSIKAPTVEIKASAKMDVKVGGILTINGSMVKIN